MDRNNPAIVYGMLATLLLAGCTSRHQNLNIQAAGEAALTQPTGAEELIAAGRGYLDKQNYGLAISQFREALRFDASSAAANNGLGIAYAAIGRDDLARRHFERAIAFAPDQAAYRRNLERFASGNAPVRAQMAEQASPAVEEAAPVAVSYHLRQDVSAAAMPVPAVANAPSTGPRLAANATGMTLVTKPGPVAPQAQPVQTAEAPIIRYPALPYTLERKAAAPVSAPQPALKRVSRYEVRIATRQPAEALAEIMKRDYLAQWNEPIAAAPSSRPALTGADAFRAALGGARLRLETSLSVGLAEQACVRAGRALDPSGLAQCSS